MRKSTLFGWWLSRKQSIEQTNKRRRCDEPTLLLTLLLLALCNLRACKHLGDLLVEIGIDNDQVADPV